jgi:hypothetical protein
MDITAVSATLTMTGTTGGTLTTTEGTTRGDAVHARRHELSNLALRTSEEKTR